MPSVPERHRSSPARRFCFSLILLCQLAWILPSTFFLLIDTSSPSIIVLQDHNTSKTVNSLGFAAPLPLLSDRDVALIKEIHEKWEEFYPALKAKVVAKGFIPPFPRTCFIWLPECFSLAKHSRIVQIVEETLGRNALLYGMTVWQGKNEAMQRFHRDGIVLGCEKTLNFVTGAGLHLISRSHKIPERLLQAVLRNVLIIEDDSLKISNKDEQLSFFERSFLTRIKRMVRTPEIWLETLDAEPGYGVFFHGGSIYRIEETIGGGPAMLLQFISGDCKVRDSGDHGWGAQGTSDSLYMPPVLLVTGDRAELGASNDVRMMLANEDDITLKAGKIVKDQLLGSNSDLNGGKDIPAEYNNVTILSGFNTTSEWNHEGMWMFQKIGEASTAIIEQSRIDYFVLGTKTLGLDFGMVNSDAEQVIVVLEEGLIYFRAINEQEFYYCELLELRPGSAVLLSKSLIHALVPLGPDVAFISFRWIGHSDKISLGKAFATDNVNVNDNAKSFGFENSFLKEIHDYGMTRAAEGRTITLSSGQAYDPDNNENCDVLIFMVDGYMLQVLPFDSTLLPLDILLIPSSQSCVLWNTAGTSVKFFAMHVCHYEDTIQIMTSYGASGKIF